jgi:hypothetical protein
MKTNIKAFQLIEKGLSAKTVSKLTESQIDVLHNKLFKDLLSEQTTPGVLKVAKGSPQEKEAMDKKQSFIAYEEELDEQGGVEVDKDNASSGEYTQDMPQKSAPDGMDDDLDNPNEKNAVGTVESIEEAKNKPNPWAICHSQVGPKKSRKWERCVKEVKKQLGEGKNPVSLFLENEIMKIVERNLPPKITKGDLIKYLSEAPATAPSKPKTSPTTKPGAPDKKPRPSHPGKNPNPGEKESPKAKRVSPEQAKDEVIDAIMKLLQK